MPLTAHLEELRKRLLVSIVAVGIAMVVTFNQSHFILQLVQAPLNTTYVFERVPPYVQAKARPEPLTLYFHTPTEPFWTHLKLAFFAALFLSVPVILFEVWRFIAPGLLPGERHYALPFVVLSTLFFALGLAFCYKVVLPFALNFLVSFDENLKPILTVGEYVDFCVKFLLAFGLIFELPLVITLMARMGLTTPAFLARNRKYAVLLAFIIGAILTPTPDVFNQTLMAGPLIILYEIGIISARLFGRKKPAEA
ncbi:MAG: twin-arginine translocase subunit TatC [Nitrospirae bacterium]|nr:twin-arginine translocase subunit TatC [Nitrospirota bacterium]